MTDRFPDRTPMTENADKALSIAPRVRPTAEIKASMLGRDSEVGARPKLLEERWRDRTPSQPSTGA